MDKVDETNETTRRKFPQGNRGNARHRSGEQELRRRRNVQSAARANVPAKSSA